MQPFTVLTAVAAPLEIAKIDTGMILPGRYMRRHRQPGHDYGEAFLYDLRFDESGRPRADFVLNDPAYRDAKILVTGSDFGCGSSRRLRGDGFRSPGAGRTELRRNIPGQLHPERSFGDYACRDHHPQHLAAIARAAGRGDDHRLAQSI